jgi:hypothetical protein
MDHVRAAGKVHQRNQAASDCLNPISSPYTNSVPNNIKPFTNTDAGRPEVGEIRTHWGKAADDRSHETSMTHGLKTSKSVKAKDLLNPEMTSRYQDLKFEDSEAIYKSNTIAPLGKVATPIAEVPIQFIEKGFGKQTERSANAGSTVNPRKTIKQVREESAEGHDLYKKTHNDYFVGEKINRNYFGNWNNDGDMVFGIETPHDNDGRKVSRSLRWPNPDIGECADRFGSLATSSKKGSTKLVSERIDAFRQRTQPTLGTVHDPIKSTAGITEAFGLSLKGDGCGAGDVIHGRDTEMFLLGKDRQRGVLAAVRHHLKKANYHNFSTLREAFAFYDKSKKDAIGPNELRKVCLEFNLPIDDGTLRALMAMTCRNDTGKICYNEFVNLLNWKDKMPTDDELVEIDDLTITQIDKSLDGQITSSSSINATVGKTSTDVWQRFGVPTVRSDIPAPSIRRVSDRTNYGDELDAHGLLSPSIFTTKGVFEQDFFEPRSKDTIKQLFSVIGVKMGEESWEECWRRALEHQKTYKQAQRYNMGNTENDKVSVECFRLVLDSITSNAVNH